MSQSWKQNRGNVPYPFMTSPFISLIVVICGVDTLVLLWGNQCNVIYIYCSFCWYWWNCWPPLFPKTILLWAMPNDFISLISFSTRRNRQFKKKIRNRLSSYDIIYIGSMRVKCVSMFANIKRWLIFNKNI